MVKYSLYIKLGSLKGGLAHSLMKGGDAYDVDVSKFIVHVRDVYPGIVDIH
ncbi:hypothetical protein S101395_01929 [Bacillus sonorensis]|uniref:Uncharacterized protein n=1 Tax=Bacillus sonorensis TaxID=119858 RepID=A0ABN5ACC8_9BACI|nr:hypothetical protein S101395_01929 [Bacillus sonorensis]